MISRNLGRPVTKPVGFWPWLLWALFGNDDDGVIGDASYNPTQEDSLLIRLGWWLRNPGHNLTFYVIGFADCDAEREGPYPRDVFKPGGGFNWAWHRVGGLSLPFVSWWRAGTADKVYIGWRERGNFGIKVTGWPLAALVVWLIVVIEWSVLA